MATVIQENHNCAECALRPACVGRDLDVACASRLAAIVRPGASLCAGQHLFWQAADLEALYAVRSGCIKAYSTDAYGNERVRGFYFPGDIIGIDGMQTALHPASAVALGEAEVCVLPIRAFQGLADQIPALRRQLLDIASRELATALAIAGDYSAEQRIAAFLLMLSRRAVDPKRLRLEMSRRDVANYLRLVTETVSRVLTRFRSTGLIAVNGRCIELLDVSNLEKLAAPTGVAPAGQPSRVRVAA